MEMFRECGFMSLVASGLALLAAVAALVALALAIWKPRWGLILGVVALAVSCSPPAAGAVGTVMGKKKVEAVLESTGIDPAQRERILREGEAEAAQCTNVGLLGGALPLLLSVASLGVALVRRRGA